MIQDLEAARRRLTDHQGRLKAELAECGGEAYRGTWLDTTTNKAGQSYKRLRWFKDVATKKKGCKTLKSEEVATATRAIALWGELATVEAQLEKVEGELANIQRQAARLGLELPRVSAVVVGDRHESRLPEMEEEIDEEARLADFLPGAMVRNPAGWRGWVSKVAGDRVYVDFENQLSDDYPPHLLDIVAPPLHLV